jgi:TfoX/Sxy family transcriptional regulator of competence genes
MFQILSHLKHNYNLITLNACKEGFKYIVFRHDHFKDMAHNEKLTNRVREVLIDVPKVEEKKMFRGIAFMIDGKLCMSTGNDELMCRIDPTLHDEVVEQAGVRTMIMKGREYKGYVYIHEDAIKTKKNFSYWINLALDFNKHAKASKKKTSKK